MSAGDHTQDMNLASHRHAVRHENCQIDHCPICEGGLFQCADCGAAEAQCYEVHCVDRIKAQWQDAVAYAVRKIVPDWDENISACKAGQRLTALVKELEDRWIRAGAAVARYGVSTPTNIREEWRPQDLATAIHEIGRRSDAFVGAQARRIQAERKVGDLERQLSSMEVRAKNAELRVEELNQVSGYKELADSEARIANLEKIRQDRENRLRQIRNLASDGFALPAGDHGPFPPPSNYEVAKTWVSQGDESPLRPGITCPYCGHRHPPDGDCV